MIRAALKSVFAHKLRFFLTGMAIVLGVGFVAGTFVFTDSINRTFDNLFEDAFAGIDVIVQSETEFDVGFTGPPPFDEAVLEEVSAVDGVAAAEGSVTGFAMLIDKQGEAIRPTGPPTLGGSWSETPELLGNVVLRSGRAPEAPGEITVDAATAKANDLVVGDVVDVILPIPTEQFEIVGVVGFGDNDNLAGATFTAFTLEEAQRVLDVPGKFHAINIVAEEGASADLVRNNIDAALPSDFQVITAADEAADQAAELQDALSFLGTVLLVFALISVFVGAFIIFNTFSIVVAQRVRELGLLRAVGATSGQVIRMVVLEGLVMAVVASVLGVFFGVVISNLLYTLMRAGGFDIPSSPARIQVSTVVIALLVGMVVTTVSSLIPAVRGSRIPPVAAMQEVSLGARRPLWQRGVTGAAVTVTGIILILIGLFTEFEPGPFSSLIIVGIGALVVFIGVATFSVVFIKPFAEWLAWPVLKLGKVSGRLARDNAVRRPRRAASTAAALMIGLALVGFFYILGESIKATTASAIEEGFKADFIVQSDGFIPVIEPTFADELAEDPDVAAVTSFRINFWDKDGTEEFLVGFDSATLPDTVDIDVIEGDPTALAGGGVFVFDDAASDRDLVVGDTIQMGFNATGLQEVEVIGIFGDTGVVSSSYLVGMEFYEDNFVDKIESVVAIKLADGVSAEEGRALIDAAAADIPAADVQDGIEFRESQEEQIAGLLALFQGLLFLAVIIALLGIINTLILSIYERTREIGLLRAVGMSRWQVRRMVLWESIIVAVIGGVLGMGVGTFFGIVVVSALDSVGITELAIPTGQLISLLIVAAIAGILASIFPARKAAKLNVLEAIAYE